MLERLFPKKNRLYLLTGALLWAAYALLALTAPLVRNPYHLTLTERNLLQLTIILPVLVIWLVALNGAASFQRYARLIRGSEDGDALQWISAGVTLLVLYYILQSVLTQLPLFFVGKWLLIPVLMLANHVPLMLALVAFLVILAGAWKLRALTVKRLGLGGLAAIAFPYLVLGAIYAWLFYKNLPNGTAANGVPKFAGPEPLPLLTVAIPYIIAWIAGILAITIIAEYARTIHGTIYRRALKDLVRGLTGALGFSILIELMQLSTGVFQGLSLWAVLLILYVLIVLYAVGFVFIARGAKKLSLIEESL
jgi:hypothetical protein